MRVCSVARCSLRLQAQTSAIISFFSTYIYQDIGAGIMGAPLGVQGSVTGQARTLINKADAHARNTIRHSLPCQHGGLAVVWPSTAVRSP
jgi:uncharacterized membrane protein